MLRSRRWTAKQIHDAVAIDVPDDPMSDDALFAYLHAMAEISEEPRTRSPRSPSLRHPAPRYGTLPDRG